MSVWVISDLPGPECGPALLGAGRGGESKEVVSPARFAPRRRCVMDDDGCDWILTGRTRGVASLRAVTRFIPSRSVPNATVFFSGNDAARRDTAASRSTTTVPRRAIFFRERFGARLRGAARIEAFAAFTGSVREPR